jgi:hypothetical protein
LLVLFFVVGVVKTCGSFAEVKAHYRTQHRKAYPFSLCQRVRFDVRC